VPTAKRAGAYEWIKKQPGKTFIICPLIEESESLVAVKAVKSEFERIKKIFPDVGLLHGRMKPSEKTKVLDDFRNKKTRVLVATPVVEVGIDIPDATVMVIEGADRFGLGQLHQLRGRVGRADIQSYCLLFTETTDEKTLERLRTLETIHSGPHLAEVDLTLRGPGEVFGTRQHGVPHFKIASFTDMATMNEAQEVLHHLPPALLRTLAKTAIIDSSASAD
jgi:ATP-dependent DNA helicase RecG